MPVRALRVTYVGELGWEIYCPTEYGLGLWRALWEAGEPHGIVAGGYRAIDSMRLEKGYRVWGADITPDETPYEGGVGFCVKLDKEGGFIGREALVEAKERGPRTQLCCLTLDDPRSVALGNEPVRIGGEIARPGHHRRLRLHGRALDRLRLPAARPRRARDRGRGRDLRRVGRGRGRGRAALRPEGRKNQGVSANLELVKGIFALDGLFEFLKRGEGLFDQVYTEDALIDVRDFDTPGLDPVYVGHKEIRRFWMDWFGPWSSMTWQADFHEKRRVGARRRLRVPRRGRILRGSSSRCHTARRSCSGTAWSTAHGYIPSVSSPSSKPDQSPPS